MSKGKLIILVLGLIVLLGGVGGGVYLVTQPTGFSLRAKNNAGPVGVKIVGVTDQSATISWTTAEAVQSLVYYGLNPASLTLVQSEATPTTSHSVELVGLLPESTYYFTINVGKEGYTNGSKPWEFKTTGRIASGMTATPSPVAVSIEAMELAYGKSNPVLDLNGDGVVNMVDIRLFMTREASKSGERVSPTATPSAGGM